MRTVIRTLFVLSMLVLINGCATSVTSEVTRFHKGATPAGETIAIVPMDNAMQGSLEFDAYAKEVAKQLDKIGYKVVDAGARPDLLAKMDYSVGPPQTRIRSWPRNYVHYHFYYGDPYPFFYGRYWDEPEVYSYTVYMRSLKVNIVRPDGKSLFEGHVESVGQDHNLNQVMPYLAKAMFNNFPGESGITKVVTIQQEHTNHPY